MVTYLPIIALIFKPCIQCESMNKKFEGHFESWSTFEGAMIGIGGAGVTVKQGAIEEEWAGNAIVTPAPSIPSDFPTFTLKLQVYLNKYLPIKIHYLSEQ